MLRAPREATLFPYATLFRSGERRRAPTASISKESPAITGVVEMDARSEERFSRNAETELVCRLLLEKKKTSYAGGACGSMSLSRPARRHCTPRRYAAGAPPR